jgi:hypothetical protein
MNVEELLLIPWNGFAVTYSKDDTLLRINGIIFSPFVWLVGAALGLVVRVLIFDSCIHK